MAAPEHRTERLSFGSAFADSWNRRLPETLFASLVSRNFLKISQILHEVFHKVRGQQMRSQRSGAGRPLAKFC